MNSRLTSLQWCSASYILLLLCLIVIPHNTVSAADISRQQAIDIALERNGGSGKVLGVREELNATGGKVYAIKLLQDGRVKVFRVPATDGGS